MELLRLELIKKSPDAQAKLLFPIKPWIVVVLTLFTGWGGIIYIGWQLHKRKKYVDDEKANAKKERKDAKELLRTLEYNDYYEAERLKREIEQATKNRK